ncbi:MAG: HEAT repeat domain-containing protein [Myxococcales bacterium]|nr:HEAT repeat domain-containing protein [Myxococcales bacterium]
MDERVERILGKLAEVRAHKPRTLGAERHFFRLAAPLTETRVRKLEQTWGPLPEAYRVFVVQAGASGAGPYYGLLPPKRWAEAGDGSLAIVDQGDDFYAVLGKDGRVRYVAPDGSPPLLPENEDFLAWYERWLDELSWGYEHTWFGRPMPGSVPQLVAALAGPRRGDALWALVQAPALPEEARALLTTCIADPDPNVSGGAFALVRKHKLAQHYQPELRRALQSADPEVRRWAVGALEPPDPALLRPLLADPSYPVVLLAIHGLRGDLTDDEIVALLASTDAGIRRSGIEAARKRSSPTTFDALVAHVSADPGDPALFAMLLAVERGVVDEPRRALAYRLSVDHVAAARGPREPSAGAYGLRLFAPDEPRAFELLLELSRHPEPFYRYNAASNLGVLGDPRALPALRAMLDDAAIPRTPAVARTWSVGEEARRAIARIEGTAPTS